MGIVSVPHGIISVPQGIISVPLGIISGSKPRRSQAPRVSPPVDPEGQWLFWIRHESRGHPLDAPAKRLSLLTFLLGRSWTVPRSNRMPDTTKGRPREGPTLSLEWRLRFLTPGCRVDLLATIIALRCLPKILQEHLNELLAKVLEPDRLLGVLLRCPLGAVRHDTLVDAQDEDAIVRLDRLA